VLSLPSVQARVVEGEGSKGQDYHARVELLEVRRLLAKNDVSIVQESGCNEGGATFESYFCIYDHLKEEDADIDNARVNDVFGDSVDFRIAPGFILDG
jgi:hypothetical protein